jgi:hypothetical protein
MSYRLHECCKVSSHRTVPYRCCEVSNRARYKACEDQIDWHALQGPRAILLHTVSHTCGKQVACTQSPLESRIEKNKHNRCCVQATDQRSITASEFIWRYNGTKPVCLVAPGASLSISQTAIQMVEFHRESSIHASVHINTFTTKFDTSIRLKQHLLFGKQGSTR